jgi:quercetin 2,3-dioxygenase
MSQSRPLKHIVEPQMVIEGAGVLLRRSIAPRASNLHDPFLLFDHFAFNDPREGPIQGFPTHPHRGIETVTYMLEGSVRHRDSLGNLGNIGAGDVQWMTAGGGILHEEMPQRSPNGAIYGFQLWVNLPKRYKWSRPRYQEITATEIPTVQKDGATVRIVAGEFDGVRGPATEIAIDPRYMDVELAPSTRFVLPTPAHHTALAYLFEGEAIVDGHLVSSVHMLIFDEGEQIEIETGADEGARLMIITGEPIREPIAPYGPFVMNNMEEIQEALRDLRSGNFIWNENDPRFVA